MVEMHLAAVRVELPTNNPVVLLQEVEGARRTLPIFIGAPEATAIAFALQGVPTARPMTHDLMRDLLSALGASVQRIVVTELRDSTFFAEVELALNGSTRRVSSRPSDAVALAVRVDAPIYASEDVLDDAANPAEEEGGEAQQEEIVDEFRQFIEQVRPEDFGA